MPRTIIDIPTEKLRAVDRICRALNISRAEAVRRGLDEFVRQNESVQEEGFGLWRGIDISASELSEALRKQW